MTVMNMITMMMTVTRTRTLTGSSPPTFAGLSGLSSLLIANTMSCNEVEPCKPTTKKVCAAR